MNHTMGILRLLLALGVVTEHAGNGYFVGSYTAVQIFFLISGFYMALIWSSGRYETMPRFYASRCARLFPAYWIAVIVGTGFAFLVDNFTGTNSAISQLFRYLSGADFPMSVWVIFSNGFLVSSDFAWFIDSVDIEGLGKLHPIHLLIQPPVWTLALEIYFYALCPFLVRAKTWVLVLMIAIVILARILGYYYGLNSNPYHSRFFPFEISIFLLGILAYRLFISQGSLALCLRGPVGCGVAVGYLCVVMYFYDIVKFIPLPSVYGFQDYIHSLLLYLLSVPAIVGLFSWTARLQFDRMIGEFSYPIYISHYAFVSTLLHTKLGLPFNMAPFWPILILTVTAAVLIHVAIQRPVDKIRIGAFAATRS